MKPVLLIGRLFVALVVLYAILLSAMFLTQRALIFPAPAAFPPVPAGYGRVAFKTADGLELAGVWRAPKVGRPVVLFFHGNGDSWSGGASAMAALAEAGYGIFLPEYRGYGGNPGSPSESGLYQDGRAALAWLQALGVGPDQILLIGNSIGGGPATQLATETKPLALILVSPFASVTRVVAERFPWIPARLLVRDPFDNEARIGLVSAPILILHSTADGLIPHTHSQRLAQSNPSAKLVLVPGVGHELAYLPAAQRVELDWLAGL